MQSWVAVPADLDGPSVVLTETDAGLAYDSPDTMRVPIQIWGRDPASSDHSPQRDE